MGYQGLKYGYNDCSSVLSKGMDSSGVIKFNNDDFMDIGKTYIDTVYSESIVNSIGYCYIYEMDISNELLEIQSENTSSNSLEVLCMNYSLLGFCNLKFLKESLTNTNLSYQDNTQYLVLGNAYKSIPIGTTYTDDYGSKYTVVGILKENQKWINPQIVDGLIWNNADCTLNLDYSVICLEDLYPSSNSIFFNCDSDYTYQQAEDYLLQKAQELGISVSIGSLEYSYKLSQSDNTILFQYLLRLIVVVLVASITIMSCIQIVILIEQQKNFGIMYSVGFNDRDISTIIFFQNCIVVGVAFVISICVSVIVAKWYFNADNIGIIISNILLKNTFPYVLVLCVLTGIITSAVPIAVFNRYSIIELMGGKDD
jgi:ABC-type antimicrobial peptide transport system permease subunit